MCILRDSHWLVCRKYLRLPIRPNKQKWANLKQAPENCTLLKRRDWTSLVKHQLHVWTQIRCSQMTATTNPSAFSHHIKEKINQRVVIWITVFYQLQWQQFTKSVLFSAVTEAVEDLPFHASTVDVVPPTVRGLPQTLRRGLAFKWP